MRSSYLEILYQISKTIIAASVKYSTKTMILRSISGLSIAKTFCPESQPNSTKLNPSKLVQAYLGTRIPKKTKSVSRRAFKIFGKFESNKQKTSPNNVKYRALLAASERGNIIYPGESELEQAAMHVIMMWRDPAHVFDDSGLKRMRHFQIEFSVKYVSQKDNKPVEPSSMLFFLGTVRRRLNELGYEIKFFSRPIFKDTKHDLVTILNNRFSEQKSIASITKLHNILTCNDMGRIFDSEFCNKSNSERFHNRLVFRVGLAIGARTTELWQLSLSQLNSKSVNGKSAFVYNHKVGSKTGESKNHQGGIWYINLSTRRIPIRNIDLMHGRLNVFKLIEE